MKCCIDCFKDAHIRDTIEKYGTTGDCDFCSAKNVPEYDISTSTLLSDKIVGLVQAYMISTEEGAKPLKEALKNDWDIFNGDEDEIQKLVIELCSPIIEKNNSIYSEKVIIPQASDDDYLQQYGVVKELSWHQFSESIKRENRFHNNMFNSDAFASFLSVATKNYPKGTKFFRARIADSKAGFAPKEMFAPPVGRRRAGRINPKGIGVLYLTSDNLTALTEVRASVYDFVSIGEFCTKTDLRIVDLSSISKMSPFLYQGDIEQFFVNRKVFQEMALEIAKPLRRSDSVLEYLPTQYISEFVKSQGYDGVAYESALHSGGYNIAVYDELLLDCLNVKTVEVKQVDYKFED